MESQIEISKKECAQIEFSREERRCLIMATISIRHCSLIMFKHNLFKRIKMCANFNCLGPFWSVFEIGRPACTAVHAVSAVPYRSSFRHSTVSQLFLNHYSTTPTFTLPSLYRSLLPFACNVISLMCRCRFCGNLVGQPFRHSRFLNQRPIWGTSTVLSPYIVRINIFIKILI